MDYSSAFVSVLLLLLEVLPYPFHPLLNAAEGAKDIVIGSHQLFTLSMPFDRTDAGMQIVKKRPSRTDGNICDRPQLKFWIAW